MTHEDIQKPPKKRIRRWDIFNVFLRSFFIQSVWNYRSLISIGFSVCLFPIVKRLYPNPSERQSFLKRHLKFFNAHPYMASYALGVSIRLEEASAIGESDAQIKLNRVKELLISTLGAVGDNLFWYTIKPFSLIIGVIVLFVSITPQQTVIGMIITFLIYNIPHIYLRYKGIVEGYNFGLEIYKSFNSQRFNRLGKVYFYIGVTAFLLFLAILISKLIQVNSLFVLIVGSSILITTLSFYYSRNFYFSVLLTVVINILIGTLFL